MSQFNLRYVPTLSCNEFILNGQRFNTQGAVIGNSLTTALTTEVIINDQTKNQALYEEIVGNIHGNTFPQLQAEIDALEANVAILQGNVIALEAEDVFLQSQIFLLSGNVVINANAIAELINDTQFLEAPYAGLEGNTSFFWRGLQVYNTPTDTINETTGTGIFSYLDNAGNVASQIQLRVQDTKNLFVKGSTTITTPSNGLVTIGGASNSAMTFNVGNGGGNNNVEVAMNGNITLRGDGNSRVSVYTKAQLVPIPANIKTAEIVGSDEANVLGKKVTAKSDDGGTMILTTDAAISSATIASVTGGGGSGQFRADTGGSNVLATNGKGIDIQCASGSSNNTINIGTQQGALDTGYTIVNIGNANPATLRTSSTFLDGDTYLPKIPNNPGGWDNLAYIGLPTPSSGLTHGPLKSTFNPYIRSISTFCPEVTFNTFYQTSGTFSVAVGLGAITLNAGAGGVLVNCLGGLCSLTSLVGGVSLTTAGGAIALTTGAGIIQMTTGAAPIAMETNIGDILLKAGYSNQSTPQLSLGSVYIQARDYTYITPDNGVIVGEGVVTPFTANLLNTMSYTLTGNLYSNIGTPNNLRGVYSNSFVSPASQTTLLNPVTSNLVYFNALDQVGEAASILLNMDINPASMIAFSQLAIVPAGNVTGNLTNTTTNFYFPDNTVLPLNANLSLFVYPTTDNAPSNIGRYKYSTWQSNIQIQSNISGLVNVYIEPNPPSYDNYMTVLGNVGILSDLEVGANITVASSSFPLEQTFITRNSVTTTGNMTCNTLNYVTLNPPIAPGGGGVNSIIAGTNVSISPLSGLGNVVINCTLPNVAGVSQIIAGNGIQISPIIGTGNVTVSLAGSVIPPGGYLPISGGSMTGSIFQSPSSNITDNTIKKYRPLTSYQPPFPSISTPTFTGEQLTFFNGDNSPEQTYFTGWFPQNMFSYQPTVITQAIVGVPSNFYSSTGGTAMVATDFQTAVDNLTVGQRINGGSIIVNSSLPGWNGVNFFLFTAPVGEQSRQEWTLMYQTPLNNFPTAAGTYSLSDVDFTYTGSIAQQGQNWVVISTDIDDGVYISLNTVNTQVSTVTTNYWDGNISNYVPPDEYFIGVQGDATTSILYEYFPASNTVNKLLAVTLSGGNPGIINGIYYDDVAVTRQIIVYGNFLTIVTASSTITANHIFQYNIDTGAITVLTTSTADPAYVGNLPKGVNGQVYGVEKQSSLFLSRKVWIWGDFTGVAQMGNPSQPSDCTLTCGINYTQSDAWNFNQQWGITNSGQSLNMCRGGKIANDDPNFTSTFALMVWATTRNAVNFRTISIAYYSGGNISSTLYPFSNGNFGNPALTTNVVSRIDPVFITVPGTNALVFCGSYIGSASDGTVDVVCYALSSTNTTNNNFNPANNPPWANDLKILADSGDASFWYPNNNLIETTTYQKMTNEVAVIGTNGYATTTTNGGGVLTFNNDDFYDPTPTVSKFLIDNVPAYSVKNVIGTNAPAVNLSCSLNEDNFWYGQTFNATTPAPPTIPTVNAINGAKFLVNNTEMDKIVFSGGDTDFASVSFIAGSVENGDPHWYWQAQVGELDYYAGITFYPNISACPPQIGPTSSTLGNVMINGAIASTNLNMNNFNIQNVDTITSANIMTLLPVNAVEVGIGGRRQEIVTFVILDTGTLTSQNPFPLPSGIIQSSTFTVLTTDVQPTQFDFAVAYEDGLGGSSIVTMELIQDENSVETVIFTTGSTYSSGSGLTTISVPIININLNPSATKFYFFRLTVPNPTLGISYYGTTVDGLTLWCEALGTKLEEISDPTEYFNVYGTTFFQDSMLLHANLTIANPAVVPFNSVLDYNQLLMTGPTYNTAVGPGQIFVNNVNNQVRTEGNQITVGRIDIVEKSVLGQTDLVFTRQAQGLTTSISTTQLIINSSGAVTPVASGSLGLGTINLNHNTNGSSIILKKDSVSVATDVISTISSVTRDSASVSREFSRISTRASAVGTGNQDGTLAISTLINGVLIETFNFNGNDNEINSFRPLDMNGQSIKTNSGNLTISSTASTGVGNITVSSKPITGTITLEGGGITGNAAIVINTTNLQFNNTTTATSTTNHNATLGTTSNIPDITNYLKVSLNGSFIWIPYFTQDPSV